MLLASHSNVFSHVFFFLYFQSFNYPWYLAVWNCYFYLPYWMFALAESCFRWPPIYKVNTLVCTCIESIYYTNSENLFTFNENTHSVYFSYFNWYSSSNPLKRQPKLWKMVSSRAQKMFKKFIEPREERRSANFLELPRFLDDRWLGKGYTDRVRKYEYWIWTYFTRFVIKNETNNFYFHFSWWRHRRALPINVQFP